MQCDGCISGNISFDSVCCVNEVLIKCEGKNRFSNLTRSGCKQVSPISLIILCLFMVIIFVIATTLARSGI